MIGHQILLGLQKENLNINAHFKKKRTKQKFLKSENTKFHFIEITAVNIQEFLDSVNPDLIINALGITIRRLDEYSLSR